MICITLNDLSNAEWFFASLKSLCVLKWFLQRLKICTALIWSAIDDLHNVESFGLRWIIEYRLLNKCQMCLFEKILYNIVDFFLIWKYQEEIFSALFQKLIIKRCFWSLQWKLLLMYFPDVFNNFLNKSDASLSYMM